MVVCVIKVCTSFRLRFTVFSSSTQYSFITTSIINGTQCCAVCYVLNNVKEENDEYDNIFGIYFDIAASFPSNFYRIVVTV